MAYCFFVVLFLELAVEVFAKEPHDRFDHQAHNNSFFNEPSRSLKTYNASSAGEHCAKTPDCPVKQYCDYLQTCYDCSYLTEKCDAIDGDCCSASFLHNCPSNPLKSKCHPCEAALVAACQSTRTKAFDCAQCSGVHQHDLKAAGCSNDEVARWCSGQPVDPIIPIDPCGVGGNGTRWIALNQWDKCTQDGGRVCCNNWASPWRGGCYTGDECSTSCNSCSVANICYRTPGASLAGGPWWKKC